MKELLIRPERCLGCRSCELAAAAAVNLPAPWPIQPVKTCSHVSAKNPARNSGFMSPVTEKLPSRCSAATVRMRPVSMPVSPVPCTGMKEMLLSAILIFVSAAGCALWSARSASSARNISKDGLLNATAADLETPACVNACPTAALTYQEINVVGREKRQAVLTQLQQS